MARNHRAASATHRKTTPKLLSMMLATALAAGCGTSKTDQEYLQSANDFAKKGDYQSASIEIKNALQQNPQNAQARLLLAQLYLRTQQGAAAEKELEKAISYGADKTLLVDDLATALYYQFKFENLLEQTLQIEGLTTAQKSHLFLLRGLSQLALRKSDDAIVEFRMAEAEAPDEPVTQVSLAYLEVADEKLDEALERLNRLIEKHDDIAEAFILRARILTDKNELEQAIKDTTRAVALEPNRFEIYIYLSKLHLSANQYEEAEKNIDVVLQRAPSHFSSNLLKAGIRLQLKDYAGALKSAETALGRAETDKRAKLMVGMSHFYLENFESARKQLLSVVDGLPPDHVAHRMLAYCNFRLGYSADALKSFSETGEISSKDIALMNEFGSKLAQQGNLAEAQAWFEKANQANPDDVSVQTRLGIIKLMQNEESGVDELESLLKKQDNAPAARMALIEYKLNKGENAEAKRLAQEVIDKNPAAPDGYVLQGMVHNALKDFDAAIGYFTSAIKKDEGNIPAHMNLVKSYVAKQDAGRASTQLEKVLALNPVHETALIQYFAISRSQGNPDPAYKLIKEAVTRHPEQQSLKIIQGGALLELGKAEEAVAILVSVPKNDRAYAAAQQLIGRIEAGNGRFEQALAHYNNWRGTTPLNPVAHQSVISILVRMGDLKGALDENQKALKLIPKDATLLASEVRLLFMNNMAEQGKKRITRLRSDGMDIPEFELFQAEHAILTKDVAATEKHLLAYHTQVNTTKSLLTLASALYKTDQAPKADKHIADWLEKYPEDQAVHLYRANRNISTDHSAAITQYRQILQKSPKNIVALNNLAWLLGESGQLEEAVQIAEKAHLLMPNSAAIQDTYGYILFQSGQHELAAKHLKEAHEGALNDASIAYHYALALSQLKRNKEAREVLQKIISRSFPEQEQAKKLINRL